MWKTVQNGLSKAAMEAEITNVLKRKLNWHLTEKIF